MAKEYNPQLAEMGAKIVARREKLGTVVLCNLRYRERFEACENSVVILSLDGKHRVLRGQLFVLRLFLGKRFKHDNEVLRLCQSLVYSLGCGVAAGLTNGGQNL